jgi:arylsulfatase A-like enzyme
MNTDESRRRAGIVLTVVLGVLGLFPADASAAGKPNIVFILADDLGYGDLGCFGQREIQTPNIDRLASEGMKFTHFYSGASVCAPSRCVLMTGKHGGRCRVRGNAPMAQRLKQSLMPDDVTVAKLLKQAGYATALVGKWGLGDHDTPGHPLLQGFDFFFGYLDQVDAHVYYPEWLWRNREKVRLPNEVRPIPVGKDGAWGTGGITTKKAAYSPKLMLDEALAFIERSRSQPFFLYFATTIPHANNEAAKELGNGAEVPDLGLYKNKPWPEPEKGYAAMIGYLDTQVGAILKRLKQLGLDDNTLVIFSSDNGPELKQFAGYDTTFFKSSGPYRGFKRDHSDGGIRAPTLARWPGTIKPGGVSNHVGYFGDFMATAAELAGVAPPSGLDSISFAPTLRGQVDKQPKHDLLYWEYHAAGSSQAVLFDGRWKGLRNERRSAPLELFDLRADAAEERNVAAEHPDIVAKIETRLKAAREGNTNWPLRDTPPPARKTTLSSKPNIVLILADDLGYGDLSCQGATKFKTPNIDQLAKEGIRLTDAHTPAGVCCPTRYGVMTGRYPWRRAAVTWATFPSAPLLIEPGRLTIATLLKQAGYTTGIVGKWHLGYGTREHPLTWNDELKPGPLECGFDYFFGHDNNRDLNVENHRVIGLDPSDPIAKGRGKGKSGGKAARTIKIEDNAALLHEKALAFIERSKDKPFFLYYAPNNIHTPHTPNAKFAGTSQAGKYGDFVHELDWSVGELLATLDRLKLADNTLVIFTSDNGGVYEREGFGHGHRPCAPFNGQKGDVWEGGNRVPFLARWPGRIAAGTTSARLLCLTDLLATFAAVTGQTLPADAGPDSFNALPLLLGKDQADGARTNLVMQARAASVFRPKQQEDMWAVRDGNWKLVMGQGSGYSTEKTDRAPYLKFAQVGMVNSDFTPDGQLKPDAPPMQLYDLAADPGETKNLYREHPDIVARLTKLFEQLRDANRSH